MRTLPAIVLALALPSAAMAQLGDPMTAPVTPRDVAWYMANAAVMRQTLRVCYSNAAYADTADCQNANAASAGLMGQAYSQANVKAFAANPALDIRNPAYWSANPLARAGVLMQCKRRGPGDELMLRYCGAAARSQLSDLGAHR